MTKIILIAVALLCSGFANAEGRPLNKMERQALTKAIKDQLKDPDSAKFKLGNFIDPDSGYYCGLVNSKNSYGGYVGFTPFQGFIFKRDNGPYISHVLGLGDSPEVVVQMCRERGYILS